QNRGRDFVQPRAAVSFRYAPAQQAYFAALTDQFRHQARFLVFQVLHQRQHFLHHKLFRGLPDQFLIVSQIRRREHILGGRRLQQKASSLCRWFADDAGGHKTPPDWCCCEGLRALRSVEKLHLTLLRRNCTPAAHASQLNRSTTVTKRTPRSLSDAFEDAC